MIHKKILIDIIFYQIDNNKILYQFNIKIDKTKLIKIKRILETNIQIQNKNNKKIN